MLKTADPTVRGIIARSKQTKVNLVSDTGALALIRAGAKLLPRSYDSATGRYEHELHLDEEQLRFKYCSVNPLLSKERLEEIDDKVFAWWQHATAADQGNWDALVHGDDDHKTADFLSQRTDLPMHELVIYIVDLWEQKNADDLLGGTDGD